MFKHSNRMFGVQTSKNRVLSAPQINSICAQIEKWSFKTVFFQIGHRNFWRERKTDEKSPTIILKRFCRPAHPFNCLWLICIPVPMYIHHQCWERKCVMGHPSTRRRNSTIPCHLLYDLLQYDILTQSYFCVCKNSHFRDRWQRRWRQQTTTAIRRRRRHRRRQRTTTAIRRRRRHRRRQRTTTSIRRRH